MNPLVCIIIVTWNNEKDIVECLDSVLSQDYSNYKVIVVDNFSTDKTVDLLAPYLSKIEFIPLPKNIFLTGGNNKGIEYAIKQHSPEYVMVLNPDTKVDANLLSELVKVAESDEMIGAVGPKVKFYKNTNEGLVNSAGLFFDGFNQAYDIGYMQKDEGQFDKVNEVFGVTGACILYRTKMLSQIGLYWTKIKLHLDEVELFMRAKKAGWKVIYVPTATIWHKYMQSTDQNKLYKIDAAKKKVWLWIGLRHYPLKSKLAMLKKYYTG